MKRDMDLVREILLAIEENGKPTGLVDLSIPGHTAEEISFHVLLLQDAGLIEAQSLTTSHGFDVRPKRMTWAGHEFLEAAKNDTLWKQAKDIVKEKGGAIPFEVLKGLLIKLASSMFGLG